MNLPNKLTLIRVILIVPFVAFLMMDCKDVTFISQDVARYAALAIFILASLTDLADGKIARKYHMVTNFGKFMDPLADKLLVCSALICFVSLDRIPLWVVLVIIAREFIISGFRLIAADNGIVIAAGIWGKWKTAVQMAMVIVLIANIPGTFFYVVEQILIYASVILTIISLVDYIWNNRSVLSERSN